MTDPAAHEHAPGAAGHDHAHAHDDHHPGFIGKYIFSTDHKWIGIQYTVSALVFLALGFSMIALARYQLAYPKDDLPQWVRSFLAFIHLDAKALQGAVLEPGFYNQLGAMHGTIMVFMGVVPLAVGGFGNYVMPLQIGAPDMAFPRINMASYW